MYLITFKDNTKFEGGDLYHSKWNEMPDKEIIEIQYKFPIKTLLLKGFEAYNHIIDQIYVGSIGRFDNIYLMGLEGKIVKCFRYNFADNKLEFNEFQYGYEYKGKSCSGWKKGLSNL